MSDLIDRQKAKDAIDMALDHIDHVPSWVYDKLLNALNKVPSAQPTHPTPSNTLGALDCVDRAEAIKAVKFYETFCDPYPRVIEALEELPSVQPKQKWETCFDCPLSCGCPKINGYTNGQTMEYASEVPDDCPISAQPRRGKWVEGKVKHIKNGELRNMRECSECGACYFVYDSYNSVEEIPKFCPNCGCRMEEGDSDD